MLFLIKYILMCILPFYRVDFSLEVYPKEFTYVEYRNGSEYTKSVIKDDSAVYVSLLKLLQDEKTGWRYDLITYVPNRVFSSEKIRINCLPYNKIVINFDQGGNDWVQISKSGLLRGCP